MILRFYEIFKDGYVDKLTEVLLEELLYYTPVEHAGVQCLEFFETNILTHIENYNEKGQEQTKTYELKYLLLGENSKIYLGFEALDKKRMYYFKLDL